MKALVDATPISGPAWVGSSRSASRAIELVGTLTTAPIVCPLLLAMAQRRERVGGLAALRDEQRQAAVFEHRIAIAEFGGDIDVDRHAGELLEPVFRHHPGVIGRPAGDDGDPLDARDVEIELRQRDRIVGLAQIGAERLRDHGRLLEDLLLHEVAVIALLDRCRRGARNADLARRRFVFGIVDRYRIIA